MILEQQSGRAEAHTLHDNTGRWESSVLHAGQCIVLKLEELTAEIVRGPPRTSTLNYADPGLSWHAST